MTKWDSDTVMILLHFWKHLAVILTVLLVTGCVMIIPAPSSGSAWRIFFKIKWPDCNEAGREYPPLSVQKPMVE